jgi:hypothetical protein
MFCHKLNHPVARIALAISVVVVASVAVLWKQPASYPLGIKGDRLEVKPQAGCLPLAWPYGCGWQSDTPPERPKHSRFGRRGQRRYWASRLS